MPYDPKLIIRKIDSVLTDDDFFLHPQYRRINPSYISLGCHWRQATLQTPTRFGVCAQKQAVQCRVARTVPMVDPQALSLLRHHVRIMCAHLFSSLDHGGRLPADAQIDVEAWLRDRPYTLARKEELRRVFYQSQGPVTRRMLQRWRNKKSFIKLETYPLFKPPRSINSSPDAVKARIGPIIAQIESVVYQLPQFIKHVPVNERPTYIRQRLERPGNRYWGTDYTSFEASFSPEVMKFANLKCTNSCVQTTPPC